jgi:phage N-6-adenine-methyltransferase
MSMGELKKQDIYLPATIGELHEFILIGKEKIKLHKAKVKAIQNSKLAEEVLKIALEDGQDAGTAVIYAEAKLGEFLENNKPGFSKDNSGKIRQNPLPEGIDKKFSHEAQTLSKNPEKIEESIARSIEAGKIPTPDTVYKDIKKPLVGLFTGNSEWYTPGEYIELVRKTMGYIDIDPASNNEAQKIIKAKKYFTIEDNGLNKEWKGNIWLNPPYSGKEIILFIDKLIDEFQIGNIKQAIILTNDNTDTTWFHKLAKISTAICFLRGRIKFYNAEEKSAPTNGQVFYYIGNNISAFNINFKTIGLIMIKYA